MFKYIVQLGALELFCVYLFMCMEMFLCSLWVCVYVCMHACMHGRVWCDFLNCYTPLFLLRWFYHNSHALPSQWVAVNPLTLFPQHWNSGARGHTLMFSTGSRGCTQVFALVLHVLYQAFAIATAWNFFWSVFHLKLIIYMCLQFMSQNVNE